MICAWEEFLRILPERMRREVDGLGRDSLLEFRLRLGAAPEQVLPEGSRWLDTKCGKADIAHCIQAASRYSPWTAESVKEGYLTAPGGHRIGICGLALCRGGQLSGLREITSLCIRVARDFPGIAEDAPRTGSVLILGAPGWGKTTLLRDLIRYRSRQEPVAVVDQRGELFPAGFDTGPRTDVLRGCDRGKGLEVVIRTMGPKCIALDEITAREDCGSLLGAAGCGVTILATAHAGSVEEFSSRPLYREIAERNIFDHILMLSADRRFTAERMVHA